MAKEIWVIGVDPPCPRCDLTRQRVERIAREAEVPINIKNLECTDFRAREFVQSLGKEIGTAKHVADKAGIDMNWNHVVSVVKDPPSRPEDYHQIGGPAKHWSAEMDKALSPCKDAADAMGMLMTPVLVIDEKVIHHGSVPSIAQLKSWLV